MIVDILFDIFDQYEWRLAQLPAWRSEPKQGPQEFRYLPNYDQNKQRLIVPHVKGHEAHGQKRGDKHHCKHLEIVRSFVSMLVSIVTSV